MDFSPKIEQPIEFEIWNIMLAMVVMNHYKK